MATDEDFHKVVVEIFGAALAELGAARNLVDPLSVRFETASWFVEIFALASDAPRYCPRVAIGPLPERGVFDRDRLFDVLHTLPADSPLRNYNIAWRYIDIFEMKAAFQRVHDEIFVPYAIPVLSNQTLLENTLETQSQLIVEKWQKEYSDHQDALCRLKAKEATIVKDYAEYLTQMAMIPAERQTESERARIRYAEKKISSIH